MGIDVSAKSIRLAREWIGAKDPRFRFRRVAAYNGLYNQGGTLEARDYRFPFRDASFDFVFSNSLFTHLLPDATINYFHEIARVLRPGGHTLNSMFLLNRDVERLIDAGKCPTPLPNDMGVYRTKHVGLPEAFVVYAEEFLIEAHRDAGLSLLGPIRYGKWCGRLVQEEGFGEKDLVTATKSRATRTNRGPSDGDRRSHGARALSVHLQRFGARVWRAVTRIGKRKTPER